METTASFKFTTAGDGSWRWSAASAAAEEPLVSPTVFGTIEDCMADAAQHGYARFYPTEAAY